MRVNGSAHASILPSPSLTFTDVQVGEAGGEPMMTVARFEATMELTPLLQGQIRVISMKLVEPKVRVSADEKGMVDWLRRGPSAQTLDPDKVALADVQVTDGSIFYSDARTGVALTFEGITASIEARSLAGPWRAAGTYLDDGKAVQFGFATGRRLDDGTIRVKSDLTPSKWPVVVSADGVLASDPVTGLNYSGTYAVTEVVEAKSDGTAEEGATTAGWRSEGTFALTRDRIVLDKAILSNGPPERPTSIAGSLAVSFGKEPSFEAVAEARQLDLDRSLGGGPTQPVNVSSVTQGFVNWLTTLPIPAIPGRIAFNVPAIVVGGSVIQDVTFAAEPAAAGWKIEGFSARLPGQASVSADGVLTTDRQVGFVGSARLAVAQPATFASWWRGGTAPGAGRLLSAFDIAGETEIAPGRVSVDKINARIGDATITGRFAWSEAREHRRHLGTDLRADRIDFAQVKALADLLVGRDLTDAAGLADSFSIRLAADAFQFDDIRMKDVAIDAAYAEDVLTVVQVAIGDLGGAKFRVTSGRIDDLTTNPRGHLDARLEADSLDGLALIAGKLAPDSGLFQWMGHTATTLVPAFINAKISAPPKGSDGGLSVALDGVAGQTTFNANVESLARKLANWRSEPAKLSLVLDSPDSAALAQQFGLAAMAQKGDIGAHIDVSGSGVPKDGLDATVESDFAGLTTKASGKLSFADAFQPSFGGTFSAAADDLAPFIATAGLSIPGAADGTPLALNGTIATSGAEATLAWQNGTIADRAINGSVKIGRVTDQGWRLDGDLAVDSVDLGWLTSLSLGFSPEPTGDPKAPWSKTPFSAPTYGQASGKLAVTAEHLSVGEGLDVANAKLAVNLQPQRIDVDLGGGDLAGGKASGGVSIQNVDGNANVTGQFNLAGASLESLIWQRDQRAVATGVFDLSANFESTGRSPAGLLSSMTGGGVVAIRDGVARYVNPAAVRSIVRLSDLGEQYSDETLKAAVEKQIDADSLTIGETGGAFSIAAGTARFTGLEARGTNVEASGNAVFDLNAMALDSDWTLTFDAGDNKVDAQPKVGFVFRGPLAAPGRIIDALQFGSYLNTRQAARMLEIIANEEIDRVERERFTRLIQKSRDDRDRIEREKQQAIDAADRARSTAIAASAKIARLHIEREILTDDRRSTAIVRSAELSAAARDAAQKVADVAMGRAVKARGAATEAAAALPAAVAVDESAAAIAETAAANFATAQAAAAAAADAAAKQATEADAAEQEALITLNAETAAKEAADVAANGVSAANVALDAANTKANAAKVAAETAINDAATADANLKAADKALADAFQMRNVAAAALDSATVALAEAQKAADQRSAEAAAVSQQATAADAERARLEVTARGAAGAAKTSGSARDDLRTALDVATEADAKARADLVQTAGATPIQLAGKKAAADHAKAALEVARSDYNRAEAAAQDAASASSMAQAGAERATQRATAAKVAADEAAALMEAAVADLRQKTGEQTAAEQIAHTAQAAAERAGAAFNDAQTSLRVATDRATDANAAAKVASAERQAAAYQSAASAAGVAAFTLTEASAARTKAFAAAVTARSQADELKAAADAAAATLAEAAAANDAAKAAADEAHARRTAIETAATHAAAAADQAEAEAAAAAEDAKAKAADAEAAAARAGLSATSTKTKPAAVPRPRKPKISGTIAGDQPLVITP